MTYTQYVRQLHMLSWLVKWVFRDRGSSGAMPAVMDMEQAPWLNFNKNRVWEVPYIKHTMTQLAWSEHCIPQSLAGDGPRG